MGMIFILFMVVPFNIRFGIQIHTEEQDDRKSTESEQERVGLHR